MQINDHPLVDCKPVSNGFENVPILASTNQMKAETRHSFIG